MRGRVLVIDDDPIVRGALVAQLGDVGHEVLEAGDGQAGLDQLKTEALDLVLVDLEMLGRDGFSLLQAMNGGSGPAPVIALTGRDAPDDVARALELGATDFLRKPVQTTELLARVGSALRIARAEHDLRAARAEVQDAARTDHLTGLANRRHIEEHVAMVSSATRRHRQAMSLLLIDVDHLRRVNDAEGYAAGDDVLRAIAARMTKLLRGEDMAGRWGSDEFLVIAPTTDLDGAWKLGERIRDAVTATPIPLSTGRDVVVTVSAGCAVGVGDDVDGHLRRSESALEQAKSLGRNRVCTDTAAPA